MSISGDGAQQIFIVSGNPVSIQSLVLQNGSSTDGAAAIDNEGTLTLQGDHVVSNSGAQGAVSNGVTGNLTVNQCVFKDNTSGGAIENFGMAVINSSQFLSNQSDSSGALLNGNGGTLTAMNCTFSSNTGFLGGAVYNASYLGTANATLIRCTFTGNSSATKMAAQLRTSEER